jgi:hypothetical protein
MRSELFDQANQENATVERFSLHHRKTLRGEPSEGPVAPPHSHGSGG